jgi:hypothetical protein
MPQTTAAKFPGFQPKSFSCDRVVRDLRESVLATPMMKRNKHGLSRSDFSEKNKLEIRRRCGFGCVICRCNLYEYHHFDPPFEDAKFHNPDGITLLCGTCHTAAHNKIYSLDYIKNANMHPECHKIGFSKFLYAELNAPTVFLGSTTIRADRIILEVSNDPILWIDPPEVVGAPYRLSAIFHDKNGKEIARLDRNEWKASSDNWDVKTKGNEITIRQNIGEYSLIMCLEPPGAIRIVRMNMCYKGFHLSLRKDGTLKAGTFIINGGTFIGNKNGLSFS